MSACRSCGASVLWATNFKTGKLMPLDVDPVEGGNVVLLTSASREGLVARVLKKGEAAMSAERYHAHYVTCPQADEWRRR